MIFVDEGTRCLYYGKVTILKENNVFAFYEKVFTTTTERPIYVIDAFGTQEHNKKLSQDMINYHFSKLSNDIKEKFNFAWGGNNQRNDL